MKTARMLILEYIEAAAPGEVVYYRDLADKFGYTYPGMSNAMAEIAREDNSPLKPGPRAGHYVVAEPSLPVPRDSISFMEVLGNLKDGSVMLRDARGDLWKAVPL